MHLQMLRIQVGLQVQEDSTCYRATELMGHNCWAYTLESESRNY